MALGAAPQNIVRMVLGRGLVQLAIGMTLGVGMGFALSQPLAVVTFGIATLDPVVYGTIILTLTIVGLTACLVPAHSATRADPVAAMRPQ